MTHRSEQFFARNNISIRNIFHTFIRACVGNSRRNNSSLARRCIGGILVLRTRRSSSPVTRCRTSRSAVTQGVERVLVSIRVRGRCSGPRVLRKCLGVTRFNNGDLCNIRTTTGQCFGAATSRLGVIRSTAVTTVAGGPGTCSPSIRSGRPRSRGRHGVILRLVGRRNCVSSTRCRRTIGAPLTSALSIRPVSANYVTTSCSTNCFYSCIIRGVLGSGRFNGADRSERELLGRNNLGVIAALSVSTGALLGRATHGAVPPRSSSNVRVIVTSIGPNAKRILNFNLGQACSTARTTRGSRAESSVGCTISQRSNNNVNFSVNSS